MKVRRYLDDKREGFWDSIGDFSVMVAESLPIMAAAALPYGAQACPPQSPHTRKGTFPPSAGSAPNADEASLQATAYTSGALEAGD